MKKQMLKGFFKGFRVFLTVCAVFGWWGIIYPELTMTPDTYQVFYGDETVQKQQEVVEWDFDSTIYLDILNADPSQIRFRSKLLQMLKNWW